MSDSSTNEIAEALDAIDSLCKFAYKQGYRELGYDPVEVVCTSLKLSDDAIGVANATIAELKAKIAGLEGRITGMLEARASHEPGGCIQECSLISLDDDTWKCNACATEFVRRTTQPMSGDHCRDIQFAQAHEIISQFASTHPKQFIFGNWQDPLGAHAWLERNKIGESQPHKPRDALLRTLLALVEGKCPRCSCDDLHSATINGAAGVNCCECDWCVSYAELHVLAAQPQPGEADARDAARMDWLKTKDIEVRQPLRWGSSKMFFALADDDTGLNDIREKCDEFMRAVQPAEAALAAQPQSAEPLETLRRMCCAVGIVGQIDGHDVVRRDSVIDLIDRALASQPQPGEAAAISYEDGIALLSRYHIARQDREVLGSEYSEQHVLARNACLKAMGIDISVKVHPPRTPETKGDAT